MSDLTFNKIAGGVLATGLAIFLLKEVTTELFTSEPPEKMGYAIEVVEETAGGGAAAEDTPPDWGTVLPAASVDAGKAVSAKCASCHTFEQGGPNSTGPNLFGVIGRKPASHPGFAYSQAMQDESGKIPQWDYEHLYEYLKNPQKYVPGTKMTFVGLKQPQERIDMIAYLHSLGATIPIPAPNPATAPPAGDAAPAAGAAAPTAPGAGAGQGNPSTPTTGAAAAPTQLTPSKGSSQGSPTGAASR